MVLNCYKLKFAFFKNTCMSFLFRFPFSSFVNCSKFWELKFPSLCFSRIRNFLESFSLRIFSKNDYNWDKFKEVAVFNKLYIQLCWIAISISLINLLAWWAFQFFVFKSYLIIFLSKSWVFTQEEPSMKVSFYQPGMFISKGPWRMQIVIFYFLQQLRNYLELSFETISFVSLQVIIIGLGFSSPSHL